MGDSKQDIDRKFHEIVNALGHRPGIATSLGEFLLAAPGQNAPEQSAVDYALSKLWIEKGSDET
jgi:hypothetical protein